MATMISTNVATAITKLIAVDAVPMLCENLLLGLLVDRNFEPVIGLGCRKAREAQVLPEAQMPLLEVGDGGEASPV